MPVFAVFEISAPDPIREKLQEHYKDAYLEVSEHTFLVADRLATSVQLGEKLGLTPNSVSRAIIIPITSYYDRSVWEWIATRQAEHG